MGLLPVDGVPHRPLVDQQHHQPRRRGVGARGAGARGHVVAGHFRRRARRRARQRWTRPFGGLLHRSLATMRIPAIRLRAALRVACSGRSSRRRAARRTTGCAGPIRVAARRARAHVSASVHVEDGVERRCAPTRRAGKPHDRPVVGYGGSTINTLRLWARSAPESFDFSEFSSGDFVAPAPADRAENLSRVLYPDDSTERGRVLRFAQEYFLVACSLSDILARFRRLGNPGWRCPTKWRFSSTTRTRRSPSPSSCACSTGRISAGSRRGSDHAHPGLHQSHPVARALELAGGAVRNSAAAPARGLYEINRRFLDEVRRRYPGDAERVRRVSLIGEGAAGAHGAPGHRRHAQHQRGGRDPPELLRTRVARLRRAVSRAVQQQDQRRYARRWLLVANPELAALVHDAIGDAWIPISSAAPPAAAGGRRRLPRTLPRRQARCQACLPRGWPTPSDRRST